MLTIKDSTGAYNVSTNPGGYGSPNPYNTPTQGFLLARYWTETSYLSTYLDPSEMTSLLGSGLSFGSATSANAFADGVHQLKYLPLKDTGATAVFTNGSKTVTVTGFDITTLGEAGAKYAAAFDGADPEGEPTLIDWTGTNNSTTITLKSVFLGATGTYALQVAVEGDLKVKINKAAEACIVGGIGKLAEVNCECIDNEKTLNKLIRWRFAADVKFDLLDYEGAHNMIVAINKICAASDCSC